MSYTSLPRLARTLTHGILLCCVLMGGPTAGANDALPAGGGKWKLFQSQHFELHSQAAERTSRELLRKLELIRAFYRETVPLREREMRAVSVYCFARTKDLRAYQQAGSDSNAIGYILTFPDRGVMALPDDRGSEVALQVIQAQYIVHLCTLSGNDVPAWLCWGMGFLFSTLDVRGEKMVFGTPDSYRKSMVAQKQDFSCARLFLFSGSIRSEQSDIDVFHAQAWLLLHYLFIGQKDIPRERVIAFLQAVCDRPVVRDAAELQRRQVTYEALLGVSFAELDRQVELYRRRGKFESQRLPLPKVAAVDSFTVRSLSREEIGLRLAELDLRTRQSGQAKLMLLSAADAKPPSARALEVLGAAEAVESNPASARDYWREAIEAGSDNPAISHQLGLLETQQILAQFDLYFRLPPARAERLRSLLVSSIDRMPGQASAYQALAWVEAFAPQPSTKNINLIQSVFLQLDQRAFTLAALAFARYRLGDPAGAEEMLDLIDREEERSEMQQLARELRLHMKKHPVVPSASSNAAER
ncbi:MAG: hypothetical protein KBC32_10610 [Candidatus Didemnitutus sp.]|nr:hypothetical protein [Candidatus Didemnitutus sp.]